MIFQANNSDASTALTESLTAAEIARQELAELKTILENAETAYKEGVNSI